MKKLTLGRKLGLSFGILILLLTLLGSLAVWRINLAVTSATEVATKFTPEVRVAQDVNLAFWKTRFALRQFALIGKEEYLRAGRKELVTFKEHLKAAHDLAAKFPDRVALAKGAAQASDKIPDFEAQVDQLEAQYKSLALQGVAFDDAGKRFLQSCQALRISQQQLLNDQLDEWVAPVTGKEPDEKAAPATGKGLPEKVTLVMLKERVTKMGILETLIDVGKTIQINNFKSQQVGDMEALRDALKDFVTLEKAIDTLTPLIRRQANMVQMDEIRGAAENYKTAMDKVLKSRLAIAEHAKTMLAIAETITEKSAEVAEGGLQAIGKGAHEVAGGLAWTSAILLVGLVISLIVGVLVAWLSTRSITLPIREGVHALAATASEIAATISQLVSTASETAASVAETATTVAEVRQTAQVAADRVKVVADNAQVAASAAEVSRQTTDQTVEGLNRIRDQMGSIGESITRLSERSQAVGDIVSTVTDLAEQSNLLAVNASIEAAKAGDMGKGFAVVAQEIRNLSEQSKESTKQVRAILTEVQTATGKAVLVAEQGRQSVADGSKQADEAGQAIRTLTATVLEATRAAVQAAGSNQQQMAGMEQVGLAMDSIKQATAQNAEGARQLAAAAHSLQEIGARLKALVDADGDLKLET